MLMSCLDSYVRFVGICMSEVKSVILCMFFYRLRSRRKSLM